MPNIDDSILNQIATKLDVLIRLLACNSISQEATIKENAVRLSQAGLTPKEIASILGTTSNTVSVALSTVRKSGDRIKKKA